MTIKIIPQENKEKIKTNGYIGAILIIGKDSEAGEIVRLGNEATKKVHEMFGGKTICSRFTPAKDSTDGKTAIYMIVAEFNTEGLRDVW